ncbi:TPA: hypothetical protein DIV45_02485 [Patescibacteria group bacterium]|uniref:Vitamin K epoxide reductase n=2 Tax=Bacteria division Kazan-3B-28 TaxID=1798534 RepID=A0A0G1KUN7_UNCK3|nr:MAG: Vitamin K epoxide reductase [candidate division Kazan bacterium GW2011_GWA1_44_22]KKT87210.1 MAG: Vitamin K epoxide reductase [candidate division Kazan bacterium GW2011_GWB1_45_10]HCR42205.1 hypothetical protein [Patescibacteria group bacterium]
MKDLLKNSSLAVVLVVLIVIWFVVYGTIKLPSTNNNPDTTAPTQASIAALADCLTTKGYKLYGAFWCSHCKQQKDLFGISVNKLNYIECSTPDGKNQLEVCARENIEAYPTWGLPDGTKQTGLMTLQQLANSSSCPLN